MPDTPSNLVPEKSPESLLEKKLQKLADLGLLDALGKNYVDEELMKIAKLAFLGWKPLHSKIDWEEIHLEGCVELTLTEHWEGLGMTKRKSDKPFVPNRKGKYGTICFRVCYRIEEEEGKVGPIDPIKLLLSSTPNTDIYQWELIITLLLQFGMPCGLLLFLFYLATPPVRDKKTLFQIAVFFGSKLQSPKGIDMKMVECRQAFGRFFVDNADLDDFLT